MAIDHKKFFKGFKEHFDSTLDQAQTDGIEFLLTSFDADPIWNDIRTKAYALATIYHETAGSMQPVEEGYYLGSATRVKAFQKTLRYYPYFGRGYVQLTWETKKIPNYSKASKALGIDFVKHPELVMVKENAFKIMTLGMFQGWFTERKLGDYIHGSTTDYKNARRIINGTDKAGLIAGYARIFQSILETSNSVVVIDPPPPEQASANTADTTTDTNTKVEVTDGNVAVETNAPAFVPEEQVVTPPAKENTVSNATTMTIGGIVIPGFLVTVFKVIQDAMSQGFVDAKDIGNTVIGFVENNTKYLLMLIGLIIGVMLVKKAFKQITFLVTMIINAVPWMHNVTVEKEK